MSGAKDILARKDLLNIASALPNIRAVISKYQVDAPCRSLYFHPCGGGCQLLPSLSISAVEIRGDMFGFSIADWIFIAGVLLVVFICVGISDMRKK
jgi:hypothetical protein